MAIQYTIGIDNHVLRAKASGRDESVEEVMAYGMALLEAALANGCTAILCDERDLEYTLTTFETFQSAQFIAERAPKIGRLAIICQPEYAEDAHFWETVAVNRSLLTRFFFDPEAAERWLTEAA